MKQKFILAQYIPVIQQKILKNLLQHPLEDKLKSM